LLNLFPNTLTQITNTTNQPWSPSKNTLSPSNQPNFHRLLEFQSKPTNPFTAYHSPPHSHPLDSNLSPQFVDDDDLSPLSPSGLLLSHSIVES